MLYQHSIVSLAKTQLAADGQTDESMRLDEAIDAFALRMLCTACTIIEICEKRSALSRESTLALGKWAARYF